MAFPPVADYTIEKIAYTEKHIKIEEYISRGPFVKLDHKNSHIIITAFFDERIEKKDIQINPERSITEKGDYIIDIKLEQRIKTSSLTQNMWVIIITPTTKVQRAKVEIDFNEFDDPGAPKRGTIVIPPN